MIPCELDLKFTPFCDTTMITYEIVLPISGKKVVFKLLDDEYFTVPYITDTITNSSSGHQFEEQAKRIVCIIDINGEKPITAQGVLDELNYHQNPRGKPKVNISLCIRRIYHRKDLEELCSRFYQARPLVSHLEVCIPKWSKCKIKFTWNQVEEV